MTEHYLDPPLAGFRFTRGRKTRIKPDATGALECRELGLLLRLKDGALQMFDARTGCRLLTEAEAEHAARKAERKAREAAEEEVRRLREQLHRERRRGS